jgi:hypothetical protein
VLQSGSLYRIISKRMHSPRIVCRAIPNRPVFVVSRLVVIAVSAASVAVINISTKRKFK